MRIHDNPSMRPRTHDTGEDRQGWRRADKQHKLWEHEDLLREVAYKYDKDGRPTEGGHKLFTGQDIWDRERDTLEQ